MPFYVWAPTQPGQGAGWYWIPAGQTEPVMLGSNVYFAATSLLTAVEAAA